MPYQIWTTDEILQQLTGSPIQIADSTRPLTEKQLTTSPVDGEWSINEVLAHLRGCADIWGDRRIIPMIEQDDPLIRETETLDWAKGVPYREKTFAENLLEFSRQREALLERLHLIPLDDRQRTATTVGRRGRKAITIHTQGNGFARHEQAHVKHIAKLARRFLAGTSALPGAWRDGNTGRKSE